MVSVLRFGEAEANPFEAAVVAAWEALFEPGPNSLPALLAKDYAAIGLPDITGRKVADLDICSYPAPHPPQAKGDAKVDLTSMQLTGPPSMKPFGAVSFAKNETIARFPTALHGLEVKGSFKITQECCTPVLFWCTNSFTSHQPGKFTFKAAAATFVIDATVSADPATGKPRFEVTGLDFSVDGKPAVSVDDEGSMPKWLKVVVGVLSGWLVKNDEIKSEVSVDVPRALRSQGFMTSVQTMLNSVS